jgi:hypothetical protein
MKCRLSPPTVGHDSISESVRERERRKERKSVSIHYRRFQPKLDVEESTAERLCDCGPLLVAQLGHETESFPSPV